jgi:hypothetical protein
MKAAETVPPPQRHLLLKTISISVNTVAICVNHLAGDAHVTLFKSVMILFIFNCNG